MVINALAPRARNLVKRIHAQVISGTNDCQTTTLSTSVDWSVCYAHMYAINNLANNYCIDHYECVPIRVPITE